MTPLRCPICRAPLRRTETGYDCPAGHSFDRARQGYTNLLLRPAGQHGDNREMILGRRAFLESGAYAPLKDAIVEAARSLLPEGGTFLDAGCGEGYYGDAVLSALPHLHGIGVDISREALKAAGRRQTVREGRFALFVSGVYDLPIFDGTLDGILNVFAPLAVSEYRRTLSAGGCLLLVIPAERHLWELKEILYDTPRQNQVSDFALPGFTLLSIQHMRFPVFLAGQGQIQALFSMTPYYYRTPAAGKERLLAKDSLGVTAEFYLLSYRHEDFPAGS